MKICILGGNGLVGSTLVKNLPHRYIIHYPNRSELNLFDTKNVSNYFDKNNFDVVINCAADTRSQMVVPNDVLSNNVNIFLNLYKNKDKFKKFINFGSGAEFDRNFNIDNVCEEELFNKFPNDIYGMSKQICSKISYITDNFYTLRLFGVFGITEPNTRLLKKVIAKTGMTLQDRFFDYYYVEDVTPVIEYYINEENPKYKDLNLVYNQKIKLSDFVIKYCNFHNIDYNHISITETLEKSYTGNSEKLNSLNLKLLGLDEGLKNYK